MKFRKKPVIIDAVQTDIEVKIETLEGIMTAGPGDWIITGVKGERYPCKPDIFEMTYEPIEEETKPIIHNPITGTDYEVREKSKRKKRLYGVWRKKLSDAGKKRK